MAAVWVPLAAAADQDPCGGDARLLAMLDRPTIGFSVCAAPKGAAVAEAGYQNTATTAAERGTQVQYPQGFVRVGIRDRFEFDAVVPSEARSIGDRRPLSTGLTDAGLGAKFEFRPKTRFTYAVDGIATFPTGSPGVTAGAPTYTLNADVAYSLSANVGVATTVAFLSLAGKDRAGRSSRYGALQPSFVVTDQFARFTQAYAEIVFGSRTAVDSPAQTFVDYGLQRLISQNIEVDVEVGNSLNAINGSRFHYLGVGLGFQI